MDEVKEMPILFNSEMVRAILQGRKTQTRRVMKIQPDSVITGPSISYPYLKQGRKLAFKEYAILSCPLGYIGSHLWVRETMCNGSDDSWFYKSQNENELEHVKNVPKEWHHKNCNKSSIPSIHMPRWASRITLEITDIRVERLNDISEDDAKAEGLNRATKDQRIYKYGFDKWPWQSWDKDPRIAFKRLWLSVYGDEDFGCQGNPWVWVIEFKKNN